MANLEKNIEEKLTEVFKGEFEKEDFELNYLITDDVITKHYRWKIRRFQYCKPRIQICFQS